MERVPDSAIAPLEFRKHLKLPEKFTLTYRQHSGIDNGIPGLSAIILEKINAPGITDQQESFYHAC